MARLKIERIVPRARDGTSAEGNFWVCCPLLRRDFVVGAPLQFDDPRTARVWRETRLRAVDATTTVATGLALISG
jgi:hypothetical protein